MRKSTTVRIPAANDLGLHGLQRVLFAAYSSRGHSRDLILKAMGDEIDLVLSRIVIEETRRNLLVSALECVTFMEFVHQNVPHEIVRPSKEQVLAAVKYTALKDAAIAAGNVPKQIQRGVPGRDVNTHVAFLLTAS